MTEIDRINKQLAIEFGRTEDDNLPYWRVVWSTNQVEKRYGTYADYYGHIFIRERVGVMEVKKYGFDWQKDRWILERLIPTNGNPELSLITKRAYEIVWLFNMKGAYVRPNYDAVKFVVNAVMGRKEMLTNSMIDNMEREEDEKHMAMMDAILDTSPLDHAFTSGEAISVPSNYQSQIIIP